MKMKEYILRTEDEPHENVDGSKYYRCVDVSWYSLSDNILSKLPKLVDKLDDAYKRGYQDGAQNPTSTGYEHGYEAAMHDKGKEQDIAYFHGYSSGKYDMWNAVKYLWDHSNLDTAWSAEKVLETYRESVKKRPEPYEEWTYEDGTKCVVMDMMNDSVSAFTENGCVEACTVADLKEFTGRTFPQIEEVLKAMQEQQR